jgi:hypothetical protein
VICVRCGHDSKFKERSDKHCPKCHGLFAFERGEAFTDKAFQSALDAISAEGKLKWGVEHLYYELCRRKRRKLGNTPRGCAIGATVACFVLVVIGLSGSLGAWLAAFFAGLVAFRCWLWWGQQKVPLTREAFEPLWNRWLGTHGEPRGRIVRREQPKGRRPVEADVGDYSFDRAVICDRARTVDLLLANNFHFENNCAVLAVSGYPAGPFETVRAMLKRNPKLEVFALHDASPEGCRLAHRLANDPAWFKGQVPVTDVGLRPLHRSPFRGLYLPAPARVAPGDGITPEEAAWLSTYTLELAAIRPEQVVKRLFRAVNRKDEEDTTGSGGDGGSGWTSGDSGVTTDSSSFSADASDSDGGADSFG